MKLIEYTKDADKYITYQVQPNFKRLGPRVGKLMPAVKKALGDADGGELLAQLQAEGKVTIEVGEVSLELDQEDIQVRLQAKEGWAAAQGSQCVVVLATELTEELVREGYARDLVRLVQDRRKELDLQFTDRIEIGLLVESAALKQAIQEYTPYIQSETLAVRIEFEALPGVEGIEIELAGEKITMTIKVSSYDA